MFFHSAACPEPDRTALRRHVPKPEPWPSATLSTSYEYIPLSSVSFYVSSHRGSGRPSPPPNQPIGPEWGKQNRANLIWELSFPSSVSLKHRNGPFIVPAVRVGQVFVIFNGPCRIRRAPSTSSTAASFLLKRRRKETFDYLASSSTLARARPLRTNPASISRSRSPFNQLVTQGEADSALSADWTATGSSIRRADRTENATAAICFRPPTRSAIRSQLHRFWLSFSPFSLCFFVAEEWGGGVEGCFFKTSTHVDSPTGFRFHVPASPSLPTERTGQSVECHRNRAREAILTRLQKKRFVLFHSQRKLSAHLAVALKFRKKMSSRFCENKSYPLVWKWLLK